MAFRFRQFFHQIDHVSLVDERGELNGEASLVQIHIIKFRRLEPVPEKGIFVFAELLIPELVNSLDDEKSLQDTFDQYCAGRLWEHNSYIKNVDKISNLCNVPF